MTVRPAPQHLAPHRGWLRVLRGTALGTVCVLLAVAAHAAGGGGAPDGALTVVLALAIAAAGTALADRQHGLVAVLGAVTATQAVLHLLLAALGGPHANAGATAASAGAGPTVATSTGLGMVVAHAVAVLITAGLLTGAESALFTLARVARRVVRRLPTPALPPPPIRRCPPRPPIAAHLPGPRCRLLTRVLPRRGPPPAAAVC